LGDGAPVKWSYHIATVRGIRVQIHVTFLLLIAYYGWEYYQAGGLPMAAFGVALTLLLFLCVLLHEFGHAFAAESFGIRTPDITLLPIGGLARLESMPRSPWQELVITVAGPMVNVVIAAILLLVLRISPWTAWDSLQYLNSPLLYQLLGLNILLVVFNIIPAFPMDGGRILRSLLAMKLDYFRATWIAVRIGQGIAVVFAIRSLLHQESPMLLFIAFFVFGAGQQEITILQRIRQSAAAGTFSTKDLPT